MNEQYVGTNVQNLLLHECILQPVILEFSFVQSVSKEESPGSVVSSEGDEEEDEKEEDEEKQEDGEHEDNQTPPTSLPSQPLLIGSCSGFIETTVKIKQNDMLPGPKVCVLPTLPRVVQALPTSTQLNVRVLVLECISCFNDLMSLLAVGVGWEVGLRPLAAVTWPSDSPDGPTSCPVHWRRYNEPQ